VARQTATLSIIATSSITLTRTRRATFCLPLFPTSCFARPDRLPGASRVIRGAEKKKKRKKKKEKGKTGKEKSMERAFYRAQTLKCY